MGCYSKNMTNLVASFESKDLVLESSVIEMNCGFRVMTREIGCAYSNRESRTFQDKNDAIVYAKKVVAQWKTKP